MSDPSMDRLMALFGHAVELPPDERARFVAGATAGDDALRRDLESLLEAHESDDTTFDHLAGSVVTPAYDALTGGPLLPQVQAALGDAYRVIEELGGGMSRVFLADEVRLGRKVVVKVLPPSMSEGRRVDLFRSEVQLAAQLQHPHIVPLLTSDSRGGLLYYTMPYVAGESLRSRLLREGRLPLRDACDTWRDVLDALAHAHASGVVHRDVKPSNILLGSRNALVCDFGVARAIEAAEASGDHTVGTPVYMAPEQLGGSAHLDHRVDLYAAGLVMYEMLTGRLPFAGETTRDVAVARLTTDPAALTDDECPPGLAALVMSCLHREPAGRPASADEVLAALERIDEPASTTPARRWPLVAAFAAALVAATFAANRWVRAPETATTLTPRRSTTSIQAYEWYQRGTDLALLRSRDGTALAIEYLQRAIAADSNFASAWASLSEMYLSSGRAEAGEGPLALERADSAARRALELDESLPEVHAAYGWTRMARRDWTAAEAALRRAIAIDPRTPRAREALARLYMWTGRRREQLEEAQLGVAVDPHSYSAVRELALALATNGRCDEALARLLPLKALDPAAGVAGVIRGQCFASQGKWTEAIDEFSWAMRASSARTALAFLGFALARSGQTDSAQVILEDLLSGRRYSHGAFGIASVYFGLGNLDAAMRWLDRAFTEGTERIYLQGPMFDELRRDPRFAPLLLRYNVPVAASSTPPSGR